MLKKSRSFFTSMLPDICRWHRKDVVDSTEYDRTMAIGRIQSNINPFVIDQTLAERCFCKTHTDIHPKIHIVNIFPNPSKGLFYIEIGDYKGPVIMKIHNKSGKLIETHHLMYSSLMSWRLDQGIWKLTFNLDRNDGISKVMVIL